MCVTEEGDYYQQLESLAFEQAFRKVSFELGVVGVDIVDHVTALVELVSELGECVVHVEHGCSMRSGSESAGAT